MTKSTLTPAACAVLLLWTGAALAMPTAQQNCDKARVAAWTAYQSCVGAVVAKDALGISFDESPAFAKCRRAYSKTWTGFQPKASLAGSTCREDTAGIGSRYTDNADQTVTDNLSGLVWEVKDQLNGTVDVADPHDADNTYMWSTGSPYRGDGTVFGSFLAGTTGLNVTGFAGAKDWRLPTLAELQSLAACPSPCTNPALDPGNTQPGGYWSATRYLPDSSRAWSVVFGGGNVLIDITGAGLYGRAVRGGL